MLKVAMDTLLSRSFEMVERGQTFLMQYYEMRPWLKHFIYCFQAQKQ